MTDYFEFWIDVFSWWGYGFGCITSLIGLVWLYKWAVKITGTITIGDALVYAMCVGISILPPYNIWMGGVVIFVYLYHLLRKYGGIVLWKVNK